MDDIIYILFINPYFSGTYRIVAVRRSSKTNGLASDLHKYGFHKNILRNMFGRMTEGRSSSGILSTVYYKK